MLATIDSTGVWAIVGQIAVVVGIIGSILAIVRHFRTPQERLEAVVLTNAFELPYEVDDCLDAFYESLKSQWDASTGTSPRFPLARTHTFTTSWKEGVVNAMRNCKSMATVKIDNVGTKKCSGVTLNLPENSKAVLWKKGDAVSLSIGNRELSLGDLAPKQTIHVWVWSVGSALSWPWPYSQIRVAHDTGIARIRLNYSTTKMGKSLERFGEFVLFFGVIAVFFVAVLLGLRWCSSTAPFERKPPEKSLSSPGPR